MALGCFSKTGLKPGIVADAINIEETAIHPVHLFMTNVKPQSKWAACKMLLLALPFLAVMFAVAPRAEADQHHGFYRRHGYHHDEGRRRYRDEGRSYRRTRGGYYHGGRSYRHRRYYGGSRPYYRYYDSYPSSGIVVRLPL